MSKQIINNISTKRNRRGIFVPGQVEFDCILFKKILNCVFVKLLSIYLFIIIILILLLMQRYTMFVWFKYSTAMICTCASCQTFAPRNVRSLIFHRQCRLPYGCTRAEEFLSGKTGSVMQVALRLNSIIFQFHSILNVAFLVSSILINACVLKYVCNFYQWIIKTNPKS